MTKLLLALAVGAMALPAQALELNRTVLLGAAKLSRTGSTINFRAPACRQGEKMDAVRIVVRNQPAYVDQLGVQFKNGNTQYFRVRQDFPGNSRTRWVDLRGNGHCITAVQLSGRSLNFLKKATVEVQGRTRNNNGGGNGWPSDDDNFNDRF